MTFAKLGQPALDYFPCRYGRSKLLFRGPRRRLRGDYVTFLGGIETYGRFIPAPFPVLVEHETGVRSVNLGCVNAGVDAYLNDRSLLEICAHSKAAVIQLIGAQNMSNRFYAVHPRRNDRFLRASRQLTKIYDDVDFTEFNFTRHMLTSLAKKSPDRFAIVKRELKDAWVARMRLLMDQIGSKVILLWLADHRPGEDGTGPMPDKDPLFIDRTMIDAVADGAADVVEVVAEPEERRSGLDEMIYGPMDLPAAEEMLGPAVHRRVADRLAPVLRSLG
ncbi:MAG: DUF6473 family protein [Rhodobacter sp.]|nr:DUF6473 family protein [Rhodobacter sp.]